MSNSLRPNGLYSPWNSLGQNTGVGSLFLLQETFPTQGSIPGLPHCRRILYHLSYQERPGILEWVAYPFSRGSCQSREQTQVSCVAGGFFTSWATGEAPLYTYIYIIFLDIYIFYWSIVDLQCCANLCCRKWLRYTYIDSPFYIFSILI